ncbi:MAG: hypothetical protein NVSMB58_00900 [Terriglobales bacterium]
MAADDRVPLLRVCGLTKSYTRRVGIGRKHLSVTAAKNVSFKIRAGKTLALVGRSGSGKSTVARSVTRLERPDAGQIFLDGTDIAGLESRELRHFRREIQLIFQDAITSMNSRFSAGEVIEEPMLIQRLFTKQERRNRALDLMKEVGLQPERIDHPATDFSGGQQQRLAIARALSVQPKLLVLDEALSGLDLSTEAQIANLLLDLQQTHSLSYLFISHDLSLVARLADEVAVISAGHIVECEPTRQIVSNPVDTETLTLLASARTFQKSYAEILGATE